MAKARQFDRPVADLDPYQATALRQAERLEVGEGVGRHRTRRVRRVAEGTLAALVLGTQREDEGGAEGMCGSEQSSDVHCLADAFHTDAEIAFHVALSRPRDLLH